MNCKKMITTFLFLLSTQAIGSEITDYRIYTSDYSVKNQSEEFAAFVRKNNPCVTVLKLKTGESTEYCELGEKKTKYKNTNLKLDYPTAYVMDMSMWSGDVTFTVATPWSELLCSIDVKTKQVNCELPEKYK
ncbi:hypothetical protein [Vibrio alginolyticus]|uniref:hypothetical protein n=1 Tax=Vibrio alginolyticus TaxID=663 RepID=UPI00211A9438|nr:hypothetical protein [Vibrio alginolyticus]MCQ9090572.1 hypothetical protein [Vibrio alginolyticus]